MKEAKAEKCRLQRLGLALLGALTAVAGMSSAQAQTKPNILVIMGDDIGWYKPKHL
jgi:hypothetical protein